MTLPTTLDRARGQLDLVGRRGGVAHAAALVAEEFLCSSSGVPK